MLRFTIGLLLVFHLYPFNTEAQSSQKTQIQYDEQGRIVTDPAREIKSILWNNSSRIISIHRNDDSVLPDLEFEYNAQGKKVLRITKPRDGHGPLPDNSWIYTYYIYDANGFLFETFDRKASDPEGELLTSQISIYIGNDKLYDHALLQRTTDGTLRGNKSYELIDHLRSPKTVVTDRLICINNSRNPEVSSAVDYDPYGVAREDRNYKIVRHKVGFEGIEKLSDDSYYTTTFREYDANLARWLSIDPKAINFPGQSPYQAMNGNPIIYADPQGDEPEPATWMNRLRNWETKWKRTAIVLKIILESHSKFLTIDDGHIEMKVPGPSMPKPQEDSNKKMQKLNKIKRNQRTPGLIGPDPNNSLLVPNAQQVKEVTEQAGESALRKVAKTGMKFVPLVGLGVEAATAPEDQSTITTLARTLIGEIPLAGDVLLMTADIALDGHESPPKLDKTIIRIGPEIPVGLTPEQYYNIQKALQIEVNDNINPTTQWNFSAQPSPAINPRLQKAIDEYIQMSTPKPE